ncbi:hypothetical protein [Hyphomonas jannaschiana]|uniref:hypothetical protein n=1 Tax=Hyphomonas jannaschiana TaxID=86 RepID=UPI0035C78A79
MTDRSGRPSKIPIYAAMGASVLFALLIFTPIHLAGWDHDVCFAVVDQNGAIPRGISQYTSTEIIRGGVERITGFTILGLAFWTLAFSPFAFASLRSQSASKRWLWLVPLLISGGFFLWQLGLDPSRHHDCDRKGVTFGLMFAPLLVLLANTIFAGLATLTARLTGRLMKRA